MPPPTKRLRCVIVESPYAGNTRRNEEYARAAMRDCLLRGEAPFASHLLYTQPGVLNDRVPEERRLGMVAGFAWGELAVATVVYADLGVSSGMQAGIERAIRAKRPVEYRRLAGWSETGSKLDQVLNESLGPPRPRTPFKREAGHEGPGSPEGPRGRPAAPARAAGGARPARPARGMR